MHYDENSSKCQVKTKTDEACYTIHFPKYKKGGSIVRKIIEDSIYGKCIPTICENLPQNCSCSCNPAEEVYPPSAFWKNQSMALHPQ